MKHKTHNIKHEAWNVKQKKKDFSGVPCFRFHVSFRRGFSLPETVVYLSIIAIMFVVIVNALVAMTSAYKMLKIAKSLNSSAVTSLERMTREIRQASGVDTTASILNTSPGKLVLNTTDSSGSPTTAEFYITNGILYLKKGGIVQGPLTVASTTIGNLVFRTLSTSQSKAVKIEYQLTGVDGEKYKTENFYNTVILRGSYNN